MGAQILGSAEGLDVAHPALARIRSVLTNQQRSVMPARGQVIRQLLAKPARGEVRQAPDRIQRLEGGTSRNDAPHTPLSACPVERPHHQSD